MAKPRLRGMNDPSRRFACLHACKKADDPLSGSDILAAQVCCDRFLWQVQERRQRWLLGQTRQAFPLRDEKDLWLRLADQWRECKCGVGRAEINTNGEAGAVFRQKFLQRRSGRYSVRTWNSTFHRRSEFV